MGSNGKFNSSRGKNNLSGESNNNSNNKNKCFSFFSKQNLKGAWKPCDSLPFFNQFNFYFIYIHFHSFNSY